MDGTIWTLNKEYEENQQNMPHVIEQKRLVLEIKSNK